jgi:hypothetical protein
LELINNLNEEAKQSNEDLKQSIENTRKATQENQLQRLLNEKLAAEMQNLKNLLDASKREVAELKIDLANVSIDLPSGIYIVFYSFLSFINFYFS